MSQEHIDEVMTREYAAGFVSPIESDTLPPGLDEDVIRYISAKKKEPDWLLEWRLEAYRGWQQMREPQWAHVHYPPIDLNAVSFMWSPNKYGDGPKSLDEVDPELLAMYEKLGIPLHEQKKLAAEWRLTRYSIRRLVSQPFRTSLVEAGVIFCPFWEAVHYHPELVKQVHGHGGAAQG